MFKEFMQNEDGASMTEYILLVVLIAIAAFAIIKAFGDDIIALFTKSSKKLNEAGELINGSN